MSIRVALACVLSIAHGVNVQPLYHSANPWPGQSAQVPPTDPVWPEQEAPALVEGQSKHSKYLDKSWQ
jgi:hypothetical protein